LATPHEILKQYWGFGEFREPQEEIIRSVLNGQDTLALMPTGGGKSICFQVPGLIINGVCIVISPLIALMKDQVENLKRKGIRAIAIYSGLNNREIDIALDNCIYGGVKFLYVSPERIKTEIFRERVKKMKVGLLAVDEAHCISQWGYDFRPPYLEIANLRELLPGVPVIALTASATPDVQEDIQDKLKFRNGNRFFKSYYRSNLSYSVFEEENKEARIIKILQGVPGSSIIYVRNRKRTKELSDLLNKYGFRSEYYHAGLGNEDRSFRQEKWAKNQVRVMVSTNAFGMGIDKPDVRSVINYDLPENLESYYQEAGRAGRDGKRAFTVLLYNKLDKKLLLDHIAEAYPDPKFIRKVYQCLANYFKVAVGSSILASYDFDIDEFARIYKLPRRPVYHSIKIMEKQGFIELNEGFHNPSRLFIQFRHEDLYRYQVANPVMDIFIKVLLRMYGGELFQDFVPINETQIAKATKDTYSEVVRKLNLLDKATIVTYESQKTKPQIVFLTHRYDAAQLPLNTKLIKERKSLEESKAEAVIRYAENANGCRTNFILNYFGEISDITCGICDICLKQKSEQKRDGELKKQILETLAEGPQFSDEILQKFSSLEAERVILIIREMLDFEDLIVRLDGRLGLPADKG
jgi:ATP-dependent DNA helicase RecQ